MLNYENINIHKLALPRMTVILRVITVLGVDFKNKASII